MLKLEIIFCLVMCLMLNQFEGSILGKDIFGDFGKNKIAKVILVKNINTSKDETKDETKDPTKGMSIVISPVIHNVAQNYGPGVVKDTEVSTTPPVVIAYPLHILLIAHNICTILKKELNSVIPSVKALYSLATFLFNAILIKIEGLLWGVVRYIICSLVPICGFFSVFRDEVDDASLDLAEESISSGLAFAQNIMEQYHSAQNGTY